MWLKNIWGKPINVNLQRMEVNEIKEFPDTFRKANWSGPSCEFKNIIRHGYCEEVKGPTKVAEK